MAAEPSAADQAQIQKEFRTSLSKARMMMGKNVLNKADLNKLYGYFQQATQGNCNDWKVLRNMNLVDLESKAKFNSWIALRGMTKTEAMEKYAAEVNRLAKKYRVNFPASMGGGGGGVGAGYGMRSQFGGSSNSLSNPPSSPSPSSPHPSSAKSKSDSDPPTPTPTPGPADAGDTKVSISSDV